VLGDDIRIVAFRDLCFGAKCSARNVDWRLDGASIIWQPYSVPSHIREQCLEYLNRLGLRYAAFDFIDDGDRLWFLEANQAGEWVFLERVLALGIADAFADYLDYLASGAEQN